MSAAERREAAYERYRLSLNAVTGLTFGPAFRDEQRNAVCFQAIIPPRAESGWLPVHLMSVAREREDLHHD